MDLVGVVTERTTAATDAVLALASAAVILVLRRTTPPSFGRAVWQAAFAALALGVTMALFVVGAVRDWRGEAAGRRVLAPMLALAVVFYGITRLTGGSFLAFVVYEAAALLFSLGVYLRLATGPARAGAAPMAAALAVSLAAGVVQASGVGPVRLVWDFDHNGVFHLVQLVGVALLLTGLRRLLASTA
jgi:uncharacterized protein DUF6962